MSEQIAGGDFVLDMTSLNTTDMDDEKSNAKLTKHLKNDDFFSVEKFPTAKLEITEAIKILNALDTDSNYEFKAKLTIKDITHEIAFGAIVEHTETTMNVTANIVFDRTKFDDKYNSGSYFDDLGDYMIKDEIKMTIKIVAQSN